MLKIDRKLFEKAVLQILEAQEIEQLLTAFSLNRVLLYSLLNDLSMGKGSSNYHFLNQIALYRNIDEQVIFERVDSIISYLTEDNEEEEYTKRFPILPVLVTGRFKDIVSVNFVYLSLLIVAVLVLTFYVVKSGIVFLPVEKGELSQKNEEAKTSPKPPIVLDGAQRQNLSIDKEPESEVRKAYEFRSKKEPSTNEVIREESMKSKLLEEKDKLSGRESLSVELKRTTNVTVESSAREFIDAAEQNAGKAEISSTKNTGKVAAMGIEYVVKEGDTLWSVATRYKTSVQNLKAINSLQNTNLRTGKVLIIPGSQHEQEVEAEKNAKELHAVEKPEKDMSRQEINPEDKKRGEVRKAIREEVNLSGKNAASRGKNIETKNQESIDTGGTVKTATSNLQVHDQREVQKEGELSVLKEQDLQKKPNIPNIPKTTTSFEPGSIKEIRSRLWNSDRNILGPE